MKTNIKIPANSTRTRILSAFMAFLIFVLSFQQAFIGWGGIKVKAAVANGEIHSTNTDKSSVLKTQIQTRANTAASGTSPYTYSGKYTNNNKVTVFDYVSDYELAHSYNDCWQYEDKYDDAFTAFNRAISNDHAEDVSLSENITVVFKPLDQEIINQHTSNNQKVHVYFFGGTSPTHNWPGAEMTYNTVTGEFYYTAKYTDLNSPTRLIINNKNSEGSNTDERLWQTENLTGLSAGKIYTVTQNNDITSTNHILIKFKDNNDTSNTSRYAYMWQNSNSSNNNGWAGQKMTNLGGSLYSYELSNNTVYDRLIINDKGRGGSWQSTDQALKTTNGVRVYYYFTRDSSSTSLTRYITVDTSIADNYPSTKYTNPLYFGCFYAGNSKDDYGDKPLYNNFFWQANMGLKATGSGETQQLAYRGSTVVQDLVDDNLYGGATGNLLEKGSSTLVLPYFDEEWAEDNPGLMKYYNKDGTKDITFPFYEVTTTDTSLSNVKIKDGENLTGGSLGTNEKARFYQFKSSDANLQFTNFDPDDHTGYFKESDVDIVSGYWYDTGVPKTNGESGTIWSTHPWADSTRSNVGFFPFNTNNDDDHENKNKHNLGFGTKFEMSFQLEPDGCVKAVTSDADGTNVKDADSDTRIHTIFEFEGDDDLWVFIDGKLVLDMGGDHNKSHGIIDFAEKTVTVDKAITLGDGSSKDDLGADIRTPTSSPNNSVKDLTTLLPSDSFKDSKYTNTTHTMTIFYMERGMKDSNLLVRFNYSPISNSSKMKIAEVTKFDDVNPGLLSLTKKVAEDDIFQYIVSNKGTAKADVNENTALYPVTTSSVRTSEDTTKTTSLTPNGTLGAGEEAAAILYTPPGTQNGDDWTDNLAAESRVTGTSYLWVDKSASVSKMVGKTSGTNGSGTNGVNTGGELYLMYGTNDDLYNSASTGNESSAEFENQFSRDSIMRILQGDTLYKVPARSSGASSLYTTSGLQATAGTRAVATYYDTNYRIVDRGGNTVERNNTAGANYGTFTFNNRTTAGTGVVNPVSEHLAVQLTEYVENTVKTRDLSVTKKITGLTTNPKDTEYQFQLTLTNVFDDSAVNVVDYSGIVVSKSGEIGTSTLNAGGTFTLKKGQTLTIKGIPYGTKYTVQEINTNQLHQQPNAETNPITGQVTTATKVENDNVAVEIKNNYKEYVEVTAEKKTADSGDASDAELELWYKESTPPQTYTTNDPQIVPNKVNGMTVSKSPSDIGIPGPQETSSSYTYYTNTPSYSNHDVPSSEDTDWILPRSDSDYIYFRDYNVGQYAADNDKQSFTNTTGKRSWRYTKFADKEAATSSDPKTHNQEQELGFTDNYWFAAEFYGNGKKTVKYAMWERFVDDFTYTPYGESSSTTVKTVVWKIQPPDGYTQVRFILLSGDNWIRSTEKITFNLGEIYHKTNWGGNYSNGNYYDVPVNKETANANVNYNRQLWAPAVQSATGSVNDNRNIAIDQPRKYEPTNQKIIFYCNSLQVWHNIHIEFFTQDDTSTAANAISEGGHKYVPVNNQAFPGYMMEPYAYAESNYRLRSSGIEQYLTYELTIPEGATHFRINNGVDNSPVKGSYSLTTVSGGQSPYAYRTNIQEIQNDAGVKNGGNYFLLKASATSTQTCLSGGNPIAVPLVKDTDGAITNLSKEDKTKTYTDSDVTSDCDYIYFMKETSDTSWGDKVYAYFYGGGNLRDDNWQRACYSAWPGVAPAGTDYDSVHSNTYSIQTTGNTYNGNNSSGTLSPDATFSYTKDGKNYTVYKFRIPMGDRKNYSKVIFNNGLGGGQETGVIDYHSGYMYTKNGTSTQRYENKPTVTYTGRSVTINEGEQNEETWTEYVYIRNRQNLDDLHITFYDGDGNQILQKGCGYVMDYAGKRTDDDPSGTYEYYRMPIPAKAASFSVNNGKGTTATAKAEIIRYGTDGKVKSDANASSSDRFVYDLYSNALTRLTYSAGTPQAHTVTTTEGQTERTHNYTVRQTTTGVDDTLNIRDDAPWGVAIGGARVTFYDEHGAPIGDGAYTMIKTNADSDDKVWYTKKIPEGAESFSVSYTKGSTPTTTTTPKYPIYPGTTAGADGNVTTSGNMYYKTESGGKLSLIYTESTYSEVNDETYAKRGDDLYLKCLKTEKTTNWKDMTVTFYTGSGTVIRSGVTAKFVNDDEDDTHSWYKVSIPEGAEKFTVTGGTTTHTTDKADIYELRSKYSRFRKDYTLGDMQYELPSSSSETPNKAPLLYPIFTPDDEYTLELGNGQTISSIGSLIPVDETQISTYAGAAGETRPTTTAENVSPVLYNTSSTNITYSWEEEGTGDGKLRFNNSNLGWDTVYAHFYKKTGNVDTDLDTWPGSAVTDEGVDVPEGANHVIFNRNDNNDDYKLDVELNNDNNFGKNKIFVPTYDTSVATQKYVYFAFINNENWNGYVYFFNNSGAVGAEWKGTELASSGYNNAVGAPNGGKGYRIPIPSGATKAIFMYWYNKDGDHYYRSEEVTLDDIPNGKGIYGKIDNATNSTYDQKDQNNNYIVNDVVQYTPSSGVIYNNSDYKKISGGTFQNSTLGSGFVFYNYTYQPEDRYGMLSEQNTNNDSTLGFNDVNDFIYVTVPNSITKPYIKFFDASSNLINAAVSNGSSNGLLLNAAGLTLNGEEYSMLASEDALNATKTYRVRLPKNAAKFAICDGTATGTAHSLYSTAVAPLTVRADNGQIPTVNYEGNTVDLTNFHHAGSSFSVAANKTITLTDVRGGVVNDEIISYTTCKSDMDDPLNPKTDDDYVFLTLPAAVNTAWTTVHAPYAYFYGDFDGEYAFTQSSSTITWPGVRASGSYTDKAGRTVYRFQIPKTENGKYSYVMFNGGTYATDYISEGKEIVSGQNYILDSTNSNKKDYGTSVKAYALIPAEKAPYTTTTDYSSGSYIYIINNGTQDLNGNALVSGRRTDLDEMHVVFFADADGLQVVGSGSLNAYQDAGYIPDKVGTYDSTYDVYRMEVPSGAKYFQINNGYGKGTTGTNYSLRVSEIKALTPNGLYQFVQGETAASKYIEGTTYPTNAETRQNPRYLLTLVNAILESDEEQPVTGTIDIHLATIVTDTDGTQKYIKWLKMNEAGTQVDTNYLAHTTSDIGATAPNNSGTGLKKVKVKKDGEYYWKEVVAPSGYKVNEDVTEFTIAGYDPNDVPEINDDPNPTGGLTLNKKLSSKKPNSGTNDGENASFVFTVTLTAPVGTKWATREETAATKLTFQTKTGNAEAVTVTPISDTYSDTSLTRVIRVALPATGLTNFIIGNIPSGTAYSVTEESVCDLTLTNDTAVTATVTLTAPTGTSWSDYQLTKDGTAIAAANITGSGLTRTVSNISIPANGSVRIGGIPDGTTYSYTIGSNTITGTLKAQYTSTPVAVSETKYTGDTPTSATTTVDEMEGTIPSYETNTAMYNNVKYVATNERLVGSLTLGNTDSGAMGDAPEAAINRPNASDPTKTNYTPFTYTVTLEATDSSVDLRDYISYSTLTSNTGYKATLKKVNGTAVTNENAETTFNSANSGSRLSNIEYKVALLANNGTKTLGNLPVGTKYTVSEDAAGQTRNSATCVTHVEVPSGMENQAAITSYDNKSISMADPNPTVVIHNDYSVNPPGNLTISKTLDSSNRDSSNTDLYKENESFEFTVDLGSTLPSGLTYEYSSATGVTAVSTSNNKLIVTLKHGQSVTIKGIPADTSYTVSETDEGLGWSKIVTGNETGTITANTTSTVAYNNKYVKYVQKGSLVLHKGLDKGTTDDSEHPTGFTYEVTLTNASVDLTKFFGTETGTKTIGSIPVNITQCGADTVKFTVSVTSIGANSTVTISNIIPYGTTCAVTELTGTVPNSDPEESYMPAGWKKVSEGFGSSGTSTILNSSSVSFTATNAKVGSLNITKTRAGNTSLTGIPTDFYMDVTLKPPTGMTLAHFANHYLNINTIADNATNADVVTAVASIENLAVDNTTTPTAFIKTVQVTTSNNTGSTSINGLPYGTTYTVAETDESQVKTSDVGYSDTTITGHTTGHIDVAAQTVEATNTYPSLGSLTLNKAFVGGTSETTYGNETFYYNVTLTRDTNNTVIDLRDFSSGLSGVPSGATVTPAAGSINITNIPVTKNSSVTIGNIPQNTTYHVTESAFDSAVQTIGTTHWVKITDDTSNTDTAINGTISGTTSNATVTNGITDRLVITKNTNAYSGTIPAGTFAFEIQLNNDANNDNADDYDLSKYTIKVGDTQVHPENSNNKITGIGISVPEGSAGDASKSATATITGLPVGITYTVTEMTPPSNWIKTASSNITGTVGGSTAPSFTNTYVPKGTLNIDKSVTGEYSQFKDSNQNTISQNTTKFELTVTLNAPTINGVQTNWSDYSPAITWNGNSTLSTSITSVKSVTAPTDTKYEFVIERTDNDGNFVIGNLPYGTTYTIVEDQTGLVYTNGTCTVTEFGDTQTFSGNDTKTVINHYSQTGTLTLKKVAETATDSTAITTYPNAVFHVELQRVDGADWSTISDMTIQNIVSGSEQTSADNKTYSFNVSVPANVTSGVKVLDNIPDNVIKYKVTEPDLPITSDLTNAGYICTNKDEDTDFTAITGEHLGASTTITNIYIQKADLVLNEVLLNGTTTHSDDKFTFTVSLTSPSGVVFTDNYFTFKDKDGNVLPNTTFNFTPSTALVGATPVTGATITAEISENIKQITISGVPYGTQYTINGSQNPTGTTIPKNSTWSLVSEVYSTEIPEGETQHIINAPTQSFTAKNAITGGLQISKTTAKKSSSIALPTEQFTFNLTFSNVPAGISLYDFVITAKDSSNTDLTVNGTGTNRAVTMTMTGIDTSTTTGTGTITVLGIPQDVQVTVTEAAMPSANWEQTAHSNDTNITISDNVGNASTPASFTNSYTPTSISLFKKDAENNAGIKDARFYLLKLKPETDIDDPDVKDAFATATSTDDLSDYATVVGTVQTTGDGTTAEQGMITLTANNDTLTFSTGDRYFFFEAQTGTTTAMSGPSPINYQKDNTITAEKVIEIKNDKYEYSVEYSNERVPTSTGVDITKKGDDNNLLGGAIFDLWYENTTIPKIYSPNDPFSVPSWTATKTVKNDMTVPDPATVSGDATPLDYEYEYKNITVPSSTDTEWILPRSDNDYIYFRDYNEGTIYDGDYKWNQDAKGGQSAEGSKRRWINTWFDGNEFGQSQEIFYDHRYWVKAVFTAPGKETKSFAVWERFVDDSYSDGKTVVWKIQPPDGYKYVEFILCDGDNHVRNTERFEYVLGNIYTKTNKGRYDGGQYGYPVRGEHWSSNWQGTGNTAGDKRQTYSSFYNDNGTGKTTLNTNAYVFNDGIAGNNTSTQGAPKQTERYTPTEQKIVFHCNSKVVWHNIHIEFFTEGTSSDFDFSQVEGSVTKYYKHVGQGAPGYLMEPYAYAGDNYRVNGYLTYELTIPKEATHFRVNNGVTNGAYYFRSEITKLHTAEDRNGRKNYGNYFKIDSGYRDMNTQPIHMTDWTSYPTGSGKDSWNESYSTIDVSSDYDYVYFKAPSNWGTHIYAYFYAGGELQEDNWQRAVYSIWPGEAPVGSEYDDGTSPDRHSDIYGYSYTGTLYNTDSKTASATSPDSTFSNGGTIYKFRIPKGDRTNYKKVIFNNGLTTQVQSNGTNGSDGKLHSTSAISYHAGYLYNYKGESDKYYENKYTSPYQKRGNGDDYIYIKVPSSMNSSWDNMHITFYKDDVQICQQGDGYVMEYSGTQGGYTYYRMAIPTDATKFALNNGFKSNVKTKANEYYDIPRLYDGDDSAMDYTRNRAVYEMSGTNPNQYTLNPLGPTFGIKAYLYVRVEDNSTTMTAWNGMHAKFYNDSEQVPDSSSDFTLEDVGTMVDGGKTYRYFRTAIPNSAETFNLFDSTNTTTLSNNDCTVSTATPDRVIYTLTNTPSLTAETANTVLPAEQTTATAQSDNHDYTIRGTDRTPSHEDYLCIRDDADWDIGIGYGKVKFYDENGTLIRGNGTGGNGTYTLIKTKHEDDDSNKPVWYKVSIPQNAKTFAISYTKAGSSVATPTYDIYPYGAESTEGNHTETGNMYYKTEDVGKLSLIDSIGSGQSATTITKTTPPTSYTYTPRPKTNDELPAAITEPVEYLYLVCENKADWDSMTVTFTGGTVTPNTPEYLGEITYDPVSPVGGVSTNDPDAVGHWFRIPIPEGATSFTAAKDGKTAEGTIFEWRSKPTRYAENWTTDGMQYRLPNSTGKPALLYPVFTEEELHSVEVGGQTIYGEESVKVDLSQLEDLSGKTPAKQVETQDDSVHYPVLYQTDSATVTYSWAVPSNYIYFDNSVTKWSNVYVYFWNSSTNSGWGTKTDRAMESTGVDNIYRFDISSFSSYTNVLFVSDYYQDSNSQTQAKLQTVGAALTARYVYTPDLEKYFYVYNSHGNDSISAHFDGSTTDDYGTTYTDGENNRRWDLSNKSYSNFQIRLIDSQRNYSSPSYFKNHGYGEVWQASGGTDEHTAPTMSFLGYMTTENGVTTGDDTDKVALKTPRPYTGSAASNGNASATYQPEDRYGYINDVKSFDDKNNFIYIDTALTGDMTIHFYTGTNGDEAITGATSDISLKYTKVNDTTVIKPTEHTYTIRLPRGATKFVLKSGSKTVEQNLYEDGFHHAGTTFTVAYVSGTLTVTDKATRNATRSQLESDVSPRTDGDYVFFTDTGNTFANSNTVYAYFYGDVDGEYAPWPGVKASTLTEDNSVYTDNSNKKVYKFRIPKGSNGKYSKVIFTDGVNNDNRKITKAMDIENGKNYVLGEVITDDAETNPQNIKYGNFSSSVYDVTTQTKASGNTENYSGTKSIYIINNGTQDDTSGNRTTLDEIHVTFFDGGGQVVGTASPGYLPDKLVGASYTEKDENNDTIGGPYTDIYRITVPSSASYFQINNGINKGTGTSKERHSVIEPVVANGLYKFVESDDTTKLVPENNTFSTSNLSSNNYMLKLVNKVKQDDDIIPVKTEKLKLATVVTDETAGTNQGKIKYIKWLKPETAEGQTYDPDDSNTYVAGTVDREYLDHNYNEVGETAGTKQVKVVKKGTYYWVEKTPPTGYKLNDKHVVFEVKDDGVYYYDENNALVKVENDNQMILINEKEPEPEGEVILTKTAKEKVGTISIGAPLAGAKFLLKKAADDSTTGLTFSESTQTGSKGYTLGSGLFNTGTNYLETGEDGKLHIKGLPIGDYYLEEQVAPNGYSEIDSTTGAKRRVYFSVGANHAVKEISATDEMAPAYIKLYEHISEKRDEWGNPTFVFKIKQTGYYAWSTAATPAWEYTTTDSGKEILVALTVDDNKNITNVVKWFNPTGINFDEDKIDNTTYGDWLVEGTTDLEDYQGIFDIDSKGRIRVEPGSYEITRVPVSRYEFVTNGKTAAYDNDTLPPDWTEYTVNGNKSEKLKIGEDNNGTMVGLLEPGKTIDVHYYDKVGYYDKFSQVDEEINKFYTLDENTKANKTIKGIRIADYHQTGNVANGDTDNDGKMEVNVDDLTIYKIMSDGTEVPMTSTEKADISVTYTYAADDDKKFGGDSANSVPAQFSYANQKITVTGASTFAKGVYTLNANYKGFTTSFDIVFLTASS